MVLDINKAKSSFAWEPSIALEHGIDEYVGWLKRQQT